MIEYQYKVVKMPERRNQQKQIVFTGKKKECKEFLERFNESERKKYFIGQYYENMLNKIIYGERHNIDDSLKEIEAEEKTPVEDVEVKKIPVQPVEKLKESDKRSLDILMEKYK